MSSVTPLPCRLLTGGTDRAFCEKVSKALEEDCIPYDLRPAVAMDGNRVVCVQAVILPGEDDLPDGGFQEIRRRFKRKNPIMTSDQTIERHTIAVLVDNEPGVLARVTGLFSGRGYNIESLTVSEVDAEEGLSRINVVTIGTPMIIEQIKNQLDRLVPVHTVHDLTEEGPHVETELALVKVAGTGDKRVEALRIADVFGAKVDDTTLESFIFRIDGQSEKIGRFIDLMKPLGLVEAARTGAVAISRGKDGL